jgi:hypothetical protein
MLHSTHDWSEKKINERERKNNTSYVHVNCDIVRANIVVTWRSVEDLQERFIVFCWILNFFVVSTSLFFVMPTMKALTIDSLKIEQQVLYVRIYGITQHCAKAYGCH